MNLERRN